MVWKWRYEGGVDGVGVDGVEVEVWCGSDRWCGSGGGAEHVKLRYGGVVDGVEVGEGQSMWQ